MSSAKGQQCQGGRWCEIDLFARRACPTSTATRGTRGAVPGVAAAVSAMSRASSGSNRMDAKSKSLATSALLTERWVASSVAQCDVPIWWLVCMHTLEPRLARCASSAARATCRSRSRCSCSQRCVNGRQSTQRCRYALASARATTRAAASSC